LPSDGTSQLWADFCTGAVGKLVALRQWQHVRDNMVPAIYAQYGVYVRKCR
jgi:hypothetical protein